MKCRFYITPYDTKTVMIQKERDDGQFELAIFDTLGSVVYGPQKRRFDLRQSKPCASTDSVEVALPTIEWLSQFIIKGVVEDCGYELSGLRKIHGNIRKVVEVGLTDEHLIFVASRLKYGNEVDFRITNVRIKEVEKKDVFGVLRTYPVGGYTTHFSDEPVTLKENITKLTPGEGLKMLIEIMQRKRDEYIQEFKDYCGLIE